MHKILIDSCPIALAGSNDGKLLPWKLASFYPATSSLSILQAMERAIAGGILKKKWHTDSEITFWIIDFSISPI